MEFNTDFVRRLVGIALMAMRLFGNFVAVSRHHLGGDVGYSATSLRLFDAILCRGGNQPERLNAEEDSPRLRATRSARAFDLSGRAAVIGCGKLVIISRVRAVTTIKICEICVR